MHISLLIQQCYGERTHILAENNGLKLKMCWWICFLQTYSFTLGINWWTGVVWIIVMFLSAVWTLILMAPIHCRGPTSEQLMECYLYPNLFWWRNKLIYILNGLRMNTFSDRFHLWVNYLTVPGHHPLPWFGKASLISAQLNLLFCISHHTGSHTGLEQHALLKIKVFKRFFTVMPQKNHLWFHKEPFSPRFFKEPSLPYLL